MKRALVLAWQIVSLCNATVTEGTQDQDGLTKASLRNDILGRVSGYENEIADRLELMREGMRSRTRERVGGDIRERTKVKEGCFKDCPDQLRPVCGSDGVTYLNSCEFDIGLCSNERLTISRRTLCNPSDLLRPEEVVKQLVPNPATATSTTTTAPHIITGSSPPTSLIMHPPSATSVSTQAPGPRKCPGSCLESRRPVCGSDGVTYVNFCFMMKAACFHERDIVYVSEGVCAGVVQERSPSLFDEIVSNKAEDMGGLGTLLLDGQESSSDVRVDDFNCRRDCTPIISPICGDDGYTYANLCRFEEASCLGGVQYSHTGPCQKGRLSPPGDAISANPAKNLRIEGATSDLAVSSGF